VKKFLSSFALGGGALAPLPPPLATPLVLSSFFDKIDTQNVRPASFFAKTNAKVFCVEF